jgi:hypothetical protein
MPELRQSAGRGGEAGGEAMTPVRCKRCGKPVLGTSGDTCGACERASQRRDDTKLKRKQRVEREHEQKTEGGRPWRYFK